MPEQIDLLQPATEQRRIMAFDLETLRFADEVGGWSNINKMGLACGVVYDSVDDEYRTYLEPEADKLVQDLRRADLVVGFNHVRFDYEVLSAYTSFNLRSLPSFDMLTDISRILGHRLKLNSLVAVTLGETKSADGLQSLRWVKEGRMDLVTDYCRKDVEVTWKLFQHGVEHGEVRYEKYGTPTAIPVKWEIEHLVGLSRARG